MNGQLFGSLKQAPIERHDPSITTWPKVKVNMIKSRAYSLVTMSRWPPALGPRALNVPSRLAASA